METITCKTVGCAMGNEQHYSHPEGIPVVCCFCGQVMTTNE